MMVRNPTVEAIRRWVCSKNIAADPFRDWKQKHVVAESRRPIRNGEADAFARDHSTAANQQERRERSEPGESIEPLVVAAVSDREFVSMPTPRREIRRSESAATEEATIGRRDWLRCWAGLSFRLRRRDFRPSARLAVGPPPAARLRVPASSARSFSQA